MGSGLESRIEQLEREIGRPSKAEILKAAWRAILFDESFPYELSEDEMIEFDLPDAWREILTGKELCSSCKNRSFSMFS